MPTLAEYIWIDGTAPTQQLRSKTKVVNETLVATDDIERLPSWGADGSSTNQADGHDSDIGLVPVRMCNDPFRPNGVLVLCEVTDPTGASHRTNFRAPLRELLAGPAGKLEPWVGFEQEYTFTKRNGTPLGFPDAGFPGPQGPYYCAVGSEVIVGRDVYETFMQKVLDAGLAISGFNWEVMPGQAEVQVGVADALLAADHVWLARWILQRVGETYGVGVSYDPKPAKGDWNGAGMHTNFSTKAMREAGGMAVIEKSVNKMAGLRLEHLAEYGDNYEQRLTGAHETCSHEEYRWGVSDRTASVRIPRHVAKDGHGYFEDRRPNANACPYRVARRLIETVASA